MNKIDVDEKRNERIFNDWKLIISIPDETKADDELTFNELLVVLNCSKYVLEKRLSKLLEDGVVGRRQILYKGRMIFVYKIIKLPQ